MPTPGPFVALAALVLIAVVAYFLGYRRRLRRPTTTPTTPTPPTAAVAAAPASAAASPEPTLQERLGTALLQSMSRAGWAWIDALAACPACAPSRPTSSLKDRLARSRGSSSPQTPAPRPAAAPAVPVAPSPAIYDEKSRRAGSLQLLAHDRRHVHRIGGPHFVSYTFDVRCDGCGLARSYLRSDGAEHPAYSIARLPAAAGPRRRWTLALQGGAASGAVLAGGGAASDAEVSDDVGADERFTIALARTIIDAAVIADLSPLPLEEHDAMRIEAVKRVLPAFGAELLTTAECDA